MSMRFDWKSVGAVTLLAVGIAGCGGSSASTGSKGGNPPAGDGDQGPVASCAANAPESANVTFLPNTAARIQQAQVLSGGDFKVVQTIPAQCTEAASPSSSVVLFFNDAINESSISD